VKQTTRLPTARARKRPVPVRGAVILLILLLAAIPLSAREKDASQYGVGLIINVPFPESEVVRVVQEIAQNGIIRGSKEYNKDEFVTGAVAADSTKVFPEPTGGGKVFYKIRLKAIDPRNFKNSGDLGTLAVRYIVKAQDEKHTILRIDARFVEDFRRTVHASNGSVETAEYKDIHDHLDEIELAKAESEEIKKDNDAQRKQQEQAHQQPPSLADASPPTPAPASGSSMSAAPTTSGSDAMGQTIVLPHDLEDRVHALKQQVERRVKAPGAPLKSAPFHTASNLQSLKPGTEVLIVISTTYWLGVETHEGQHGWMLRDELEPAE
jgi:hypothetical protein